MAEQPQTEVTLLRSRNGAAAVTDDGTGRTSQGTARTVRRASATKGGGRGEKEPAPSVNADERLRHVLSVLVILASLLLLLALVSYTPLDQANAEIRAHDIFGLFTNDPAIGAKADTTQNWLGLLGAFIANLLINSTIGYGTVAVPLLSGLWGAALFSGGGYRRLGRLTAYVFGVLTMVAAIFGTMQLVSWMPHPAHEWSGAIGAFFAYVFTGLVGSAGSFLLLLAALAITLVYATNSDVRTLLARARGLYARVRASLHERGLLRNTPEAPAADGIEPGAAPAGGRPTRSRQVPLAAGADDDESADNEPARMVRRMRPTAQERPIEEPRISRPVTAAETQDHPAARPGQIPLPSPIADAVRGAVQKETPKEMSAAQAPAEEPEAAHDPMLTKAARMAMLRELEENEAAEDDGVELVHGAPTPVAKPAAPAAIVNRLTLNVQEGETRDDLETEDEGALIARLRDEQIRYTPPPIDLMLPQNEDADVKDEELKENGRILQEKLATFNIQIENLTVTPGPVVTLYEFVPAAGIKLSQIESLTDDIALALKARGIRIIAPIPGKGTVGVEIPNHKPAMVRIRSVVNTAKFREATHRLPLALGKTTVGEVFCDDLAKMPHLLIAGATGSGKSVGVNAILTSLLYKMHPSDLKFVVIDPKKIEMTQYRALRSHFLARCPDIDEDIITNPQNAVIALKSLEMEMDRRYDILARVGQRNIFDYNTKVAEGKYKDVEDFHHVKLPYIVLILDELADLMITAAKEVEEPIARLAQLARAIGIHLIVATQRPSVDVLTGVIKANFPARIAYQVASKIDSRTILDMNGAEQLLGNGDMLYLPGGQPKPLRLQNAFISTEEVEQICEHIGRQKGYTYPYMLPSVVEKKGKNGAAGGSSERDELFDEAAHLVVRHQQGSVSLIQRRLKVGYSRAARIVDELEMAGIVGPFDGSKARAVLLESESELEAFL